jgi:MerR family copper efflux transcriptional regulator
MQLRLKELMERTGAAERQIRYLISEGFVPPPRGGRANADYGEDHVEAIIRFARLKELGFPPAAIRLLLDATAGIPFPISKGVTLVVDTSRLASGADVEPMVTKAREVLSHILSKHENKDSSGGSDA